MKKFSKALGSILLIMLIVAVPATVLWQRQNIFDWWALRGYTPPAAVSALAVDTNMSDYGRKLFYVNHPDIESDKAEFSKSCSSSEKTIVLGCYVSNSGIYIFGVKDDRLKGIQQVTAAHEMLHAAYQRLPAGEQKRINELLETTFNNLHNARIDKTVALYRQQDPGVVSNELHSILGTEVGSLPLELENYYKKYFNDRLKVVSYSDQYEKTFTEREDKIEEYDAQLVKLKGQIETGEASLHSKLAVLQAQRSVMDASLARKDYAAYNSQVQGYNAKVGDYNTLLDSVKTSIETYNSVVAARNAIAYEEQSLMKAIDSRLPDAQ